MQIYTFFHTDVLLCTMFQAKFVLDTLGNFLSSADQFITTAHIPAQIAQGEKQKVYTVGDHEMKMVRDPSRACLDDELLH